MFVKKFHAPSLEQALKLVKAEMGPEALVLSTQERTTGKLFARKSVEVTAAIEKQDAGRKNKQNKYIDPRLKQLSNPGDEALEELENYKALVLKDAKLKKNKPERYIDIGTPSEGETAHSTRSPSPKDLKKNENLKYEASFKVLGICPERSMELARRMLSEFAKEDLSDFQFLNKAKVKLLSNGIRVMTPGEFFKKRAWVPIGIAGAGKTTSIVKLALLAKEQERSVSLISMDNRKISGRGELASYAKLIKAPFFTEVSQAPIEKLRLIDSPAMTLNCDSQTTLEKLCAERSSFLVLDTSSRLSELIRQIDRAMHFHPEGIVFTKVDNIDERGVIYDVLKTTQLPLVGLSLSSSFKTRFKFLSPVELAQFLIKE